LASKIKVSIHKKVFAVGISAAILIAIYLNIELADFRRVFVQLEWFWFTASMLVFIPIFWLRAYRLILMFGRQLSVMESVRFTLAASSLNLALPAKGGEFVKGYFLKKHLSIDSNTSFSAIIYERVLDVGALLLILIVAQTYWQNFSNFVVLLFVVGTTIAVIIYFYINLSTKPNQLVLIALNRFPKVREFYTSSRMFFSDHFSKGPAIRTILVTVILWLVHLAQFFCFFMTLGYEGPSITIFTLVPIVIFVGLIPISLAGIGTRDVALIYFFSSWTSPELAAGVGVLSHLRYLLPGLIGIYFAHSIIQASKV
jgi:glycosyltransferase 2 family protein